MFVWELMEEGLENLIALGISALCSTVVLVLATQGIKLGVKRFVKFLMPIIKQYTYKEGNDKMKLLKNYWTKVWGNKITGTTAGLGFALTVYFAFNFSNVFFTILTVALAFIGAYNFAIFFGGERLAQIQERFAQGKLTKEERLKVKAIELKAKELAKTMEATQKEQLLTQAKAVIEAEEKQNLADNK